MPRRPPSTVLVVLLLGAALLLAPAVSGASAKPAPCRNAHLKPRTSNLARIRAAVRCLVNRERTRRGIPELTLNKALATAAQRHSASMVRDRFFAHEGPDGTPASRIHGAGYTGGYLGENIAWGSGSLAEPASIVSSWMRSTPHRASILDRRFKDTGLGAAAGNPEGGPGATYTQTFGG